ncbi:MBL fold metallo-hydrolase [Algibacter mikhailovii]|uniref:MBL fold metallo-hydrolase n=1 Tax=Algibacter mikhailovii TaxID=425498 RepID=A0A918RB41_9FLAO|nr:MBL fold metallo-hydrolase [Algibacter mikhailovii]GGZ91875.1 MBL fold metallo-hydrolase [Algibacter mikhailovii]
MKIKFYGTRGAIPVCDRGFLEFGGNTTSIKITRDNGRVAIIDAGTGIRNLGKDLIKEGFHQNELFIGFSHFHWDHIQGFPFFKCAYDSQMVINILAMGKDREIKNLEDIFREQMKAEYFPISLEKMGARCNFLKINENDLRINDATVRVIKQSHPGDSFGYRLEDNDKSLVVCTDIEHGESVNQDIVAFCKDADLLVHDGQYTKEELLTRRGWGHSSYDQAIEVAEQAGVKKLIITHHDPEHNDVFLSKMEKACQARFSNCMLAREGMEITI